MATIPTIIENGSIPAKKFETPAFFSSHVWRWRDYQGLDTTWCNPENRDVENEA
jgi:hypothetical protein